jgi:hypothetical protein
MMQKNTPMMAPVGFEPTHLSIVVFRNQEYKIFTIIVFLVRKLKTTALDHSATEPESDSLELPYPISKSKKFWWRKVNLHGCAVPAEGTPRAGTSTHRTMLALDEIYL